MLVLRKAADRGHADHGWLKSWHTFSFADYHDPHHIHFRSLRVMNEDQIAPGQGFGTHPHKDMEIVTYVLSGALEHKDSMGHGEVLRPGEFQRMSAGTGITHSEFNPSDQEPTHLYQIWLFPEHRGILPGYEQKYFDPHGRQNQWQLVASPDAADGSLLIHQNAQIFLANLDAEQELTYQFRAQRHVWLQLLRGQLLVNDCAMAAGDGLAVSEETRLNIVAKDAAEILLFDLP